jgi:hypothetical protein
VATWPTAPATQDTKPARPDLPNRRKPARPVSPSRLETEKDAPPSAAKRGDRIATNPGPPPVANTSAPRRHSFNGAFRRMASPNLRERRFTKEPFRATELLASTAGQHSPCCASSARRPSDSFPTWPFLGRIRVAREPLGCWHRPMQEGTHLRLVFGDVSR